MTAVRQTLEMGAAVMAAPVVWLAAAALWPDAVHWGAVLDDGWRGAWRLFLLAGLYPAAEEVVFRGVIQGWMLERTWGGRRLGPVSRANVLTSLVFALLHVPSHPPLMAALVFFPSLVFGHARERTRSLAWPAGLHCWYNAGWFWVFGTG